MVYDAHAAGAAPALVKAMRNIPGVELCAVDRLGLLTLAPGRHLGRFVIWTKGAFEKLDSIYGTAANASFAKKGWKPPPTSWPCRPVARDQLRRDPVGGERAKAGKSRARAAQAQPAQEQSGDGAPQPVRQGGGEDARGRRGGALQGEGGQEGRRALRRLRKFYATMKQESNYEGELFDNFATWLHGKPEEEEEA